MPASAKKGDLVAKLSEVIGLTVSPPGTGEPDLLAQTLAQFAGDHMTSPSSINATLGSTISSTPSTPAISSIPSTPAISASSPSKSTPVVAVSQGAGSTSPTVKVVAASSDPSSALAARAARFGVSVSSVAKTSEELEAVKKKTTEELEALKKRADRFGVSVSPSVATLEEKAKLAQRASRFNIPGSEQVKGKKPLGLKRKNVLSSDEPKSGSGKILSKEEEEKLKKRRERFGSSL